MRFTAFLVPDQFRRSTPLPVPTPSGFVFDSTSTSGANTASDAAVHREQMAKGVEVAAQEALAWTTFGGGVPPSGWPSSLMTVRAGVAEVSDHACWARQPEAWVTRPCEHRRPRGHCGMDNVDSAAPGAVGEAGEAKKRLGPPLIGSALAWCVVLLAHLDFFPLVRLPLLLAVMVLIGAWCTALAFTGAVIAALRRQAKPFVPLLVVAITALIGATLLVSTDLPVGRTARGRVLFSEHREHFAALAQGFRRDGLTAVVADPHRLALPPSVPKDSASRYQDSGPINGYPVLVVMDEIPPNRPSGWVHVIGDIPPGHQVEVYGGLQMAACAELDGGWWWMADGC